MLTALKDRIWANVLDLVEDIEAELDVQVLEANDTYLTCVDRLSDEIFRVPIRSVEDGIKVVC